MKTKYVQLTEQEISKLIDLIVTPDGKGREVKSSALSALLLDSYNEGKSESKVEIASLEQKLDSSWNPESILY